MGLRLRFKRWLRKVREKLKELDDMVVLVLLIIRVEPVVVTV